MTAEALKAKIKVCVFDQYGTVMDEVRFLVAQIERLKPFPDVPAALARLNARYKIAVLSNGDPDMRSLADLLA